MAANHTLLFSNLYVVTGRTGSLSIPNTRCQVTQRESAVEGSGRCVSDLLR